MPKYIYTDGTHYIAKNQVDGVLIDPKLPARFDNTPNEDRPDSQSKWWGFPFIVTETVAQLDTYYAKRTDKYADDGRKGWEEGRPRWMETWPSGTRYEVRCLDGGAWDRSTSWGMFATIEEAVACAKTGPAWRNKL